VAKELGAAVIEGEPERSLGAFPVTVDGTGTPEGLVATLRLTDWGGRCTSVGQLAPSGSLPLFELFTRGVHLHLGRAMARPWIGPILDLVAAGRLHPEVVTTATVTWDEAPQALLEPATKLVVHRA
jgi:alcohol dehydrogenase